MRTIKVFGSWLQEEGFAEEYSFKRPKLPQTLIKILSEEEIGRIFKAINRRSSLGSRMYAMVPLLLDASLGHRPEDA